MTAVILPVLLPWVLATVFALLDGRRPWVGWLAVIGLAAAFASAVWLALVVLREGPVEMVAGGWPEGVGITLRADALGVTFAGLSLGVILASLLYEVLDGVRSRTFPSLVCFMAAGLSGLFLTGDIFNFYVFFEIAMAAAFVITTYREKDYQVRAAFIFAIINLLGSVVFLIAVAALYHVTGSLDMQTVASRIEAVEPSSVITIAAAILVAFSLKLGLFPFHFWLPAVYIGSHASVASILSGALANIGSYGLLRFGGGILTEELEFGTPVILILGTASIIYGAHQAVARRATTEVLAYSAIGQAGYIMIALGIGGAVGFAAAVIYALINSLNKTLLFLAAGTRGPLVGAAFAIGAFSVVGVPPAVGFIGKLALFRASIAMDSAAVGAVLVVLIFLGGALSFVYAFQIYQRVYWAGELEDRPGLANGKDNGVATRALVLALAALVVALGVWPEPLIVVGEAAAAVLSGGAG